MREIHESTLTLDIRTQEGFDDDAERFVSIEEATVTFSHTLVTLSKWEAKWEKPFLDAQTTKTEEEIFDYLCIMVTDVKGGSDLTIPQILSGITDDQVKLIQSYWNSKQTAAWFAKDNRRSSSKVVTSDMIYYYMVALSIPPEYQHWHLNRLMTLIRITELESRPKEKQSRQKTMANHRAVNAARRARSQH